MKDPFRGRGKEKFGGMGLLLGELADCSPWCSAILCSTPTSARAAVSYFIT